MTLCTEIRGACHHSPAPRAPRRKCSCDFAAKFPPWSTRPSRPAHVVASAVTALWAAAWLACAACERSPRAPRPRPPASSASHASAPPTSPAATTPAPAIPVLHLRPYVSGLNNPSTVFLGLGGVHVLTDDGLRRVNRDRTTQLVARAADLLPGLTSANGWLYGRRNGRVLRTRLPGIHWHDLFAFPTARSEYPSLNDADSLTADRDGVYSVVYSREEERYILFAQKFDEGGPRRLAERGHPYANLVVSNGWIYGIDSSGVWRTPTSGGPSELLSEGTSSHSLDFYQNTLFWFYGIGIRCMSLSGRVPRTLAWHATEDVVNHYHTGDHWLTVNASGIYFTVPGLERRVDPEEEIHPRNTLVAGTGELHMIPWSDLGGPGIAACPPGCSSN